MRYNFVLAASGLLTSVSAHGLVTQIKGANGVTMPGLSVADGTPRDCSSNSCGSQADTSIIRDDDIESGESGPLGVTEGNGNVDAATMIQNFMGGAAAPTNAGASESTGVEDNINFDALNSNSGADSGDTASSGSDTDSSDSSDSGSSLFDSIFRTKARAVGLGIDKRHRYTVPYQRRRRALSDFLGGLGGGSSSDTAEGVESEQAQETSVAATAGKGKTSGLPTADADGVVTMTYRQINQDGAGPLTASIDPSSGGTDASAFQDAEMVQDVPGLPFGGLSLATNEDFEIKVKMPAGMKCTGSAGGANNVCVVRVRNDALAGPFGGSAAFTQ